jgi:hypothetical protein
MLVVFDLRTKQLSCTSKCYSLSLLLIATRQAWHQGHCMWQVLWKVIVGVLGQEAGLLESLAYRSNVP